MDTAHRLMGPTEVLGMRWVLALLCVACVGNDQTPPKGTAAPDPFAAEPSVRANPDAGLTLFLDVSLVEPHALTITVDDGRRSWTQASPSAATHEVLLLGFTPEALAEIRIDVAREDVILGSRTLDAQIDPLPDLFPPLTVSSVDAAAMEPGVTMLATGGYLLVVDPAGVPIWYKAVPGVVHGASLWSDGSIGYVLDRFYLDAIDLSGRYVHRYRSRTAEEPVDAIQLDVESIHHDAIELPDGNLAALSVERRWITDYPTEERTPGETAPAWVAGDVIVEFAKDGTILKSASLLDRLDPRRIGYDSVVGNFWEDFASWRDDDIKDWAHGNALWYDEAEDQYLVSLRHQDAVVAVSRATGAVRAILAPPANWPPELARLVVEPAEPDGFPYAYHQHGAKVTPDGHVLMFDNGNRRASAYEAVLPDDENTSRCVEYELRDGPTYATVFEYEGPFSGSLGDCDRLPLTGNHLVTFGNVKDPTLPGARIVEVAEDGNGQQREVFVLDVPQPATVFRAERMTGLLPGY